MSTVEIGKSPTGAPVRLNLDVLLRSRLLVQANSGGGKSWLLRRLAEQMFGKIPVILIDPEGEFATLREHFGYVLVGKDGETSADSRSAELVAHRLRELGASAVCDLYEMKPADRHRWARLFLEALIDAPKRLWRPVVVIVDEAHTFAPEKGAGESEASDAVIALATRGRKRGFAIIPATQRLGKLRKDVAAECSNVLIGRTVLDIDRDRAADALGITKADKKPFSAELKLLPDGGFFALGRAICDERTLCQVGPVQTTHAEPGSSKHAAAAPPPPDKIKHLLPKLADLPKEAEQKAQTEAELRKGITERDRRIRELERQIETVRAEKPAAEPEKVPVLSDEDRRTVLGLLDEIRQHNALVSEQQQQIASWLERLTNASGHLAGKFDQARAAIANPVMSRSVQRRLEAQIPGKNLSADLPKPSVAEHAANGTGAVVKGGKFRSMMVVLAQASGPLSDEQMAARAGMSLSGTFDTYIGKQRAHGWVEGTRAALTITSAGLDALGPYEPLPTGGELRRYWLDRVGGGKKRAMLETIFLAWPKTLTDDQVAAGAEMSLSGTFDTYIGKLRRLLLVTGPRSALKANDELFND